MHDPRTDFNYCKAWQDAVVEIGLLQRELTDARLATRCFVRLFQIEGGIVTPEDVERWPWIAEWVIDNGRAIGYTDPLTG